MRDRRQVLGLVVLALIMAWLYGTIDYLGTFAHVDLRHYRAMAQAAPRWTMEVPQPFVFRILGPYLVGLLPLPDPVGFRLLTTLGLLALALLLYALCRRLGLSGSTSAFTAALLTLNPYVYGFVAFNFFQIADVLAMVSVLAGFIALIDRRWITFAVVVALGVLSREPAVLVLPAAAVYLWRHRERHADGLLFLAAATPAVLAFLLPRLLIDPVGGPSLVQTFLNASGKAASPVTWYRLLVNAWAPLSFLPFVFFESARVFVRRNVFLFVFAALVLISTMFGGDQERLVAPAFVAVYPLVGYVVERERWPRWGRAVLVVAAALTSLHHLTARFPLPDRRWTIALSLLALALATGAGLWMRFRRPERAATATQ